MSTGSLAKLFDDALTVFDQSLPSKSQVKDAADIKSLRALRSQINAAYDILTVAKDSLDKSKEDSPQQQEILAQYATRTAAANTLLRAIDRKITSIQEAEANIVEGRTRIQSANIDSARVASPGRAARVNVSDPVVKDKNTGQVVEGPPVQTEQRPVFENTVQEAIQQIKQEVPLQQEKAEAVRAESQKN